MRVTRPTTSMEIRQEDFTFIPSYKKKTVDATIATETNQKETPT